MPEHATAYRLDGDNTTLIVTHNDDQVPRLHWFGDKLTVDPNAADLCAHDDTALAYGSLDQASPVSLFPQASLGFQGSSALQGHRNGQQFAQHFSTESVTQNDNSLVVALKDTNSKLSAVITVTLFTDSDVISINTRLHNQSQTPFTVQWLASGTVTLPAHYEHCLTQHGRWGLEQQSHRRPVQPGRIDISNLHGRTSHEHAPVLLCGSRDFNEDNGDITAMQLGWSGNFSLRVEQLADAHIILQAGILYLPGECILQAGESLSTPPMYLTRAEGMNTCTQRFHQLLRRHILPPYTRTSRPIHANSWEALYFNHDLNDISALVDAASAIGAERFVLDDGWFRHRRDDSAGLGDWYVDASVYPDGLTPVVDKVRRAGMQFGLWFEPEMINPDSDLYRAHPEWVLHAEGITTPLARQQLVLDIARDDVADYLFERIVSLVNEYRIDYIKWDHNRDLVLPGDGSRARASRQPGALYQLLQRITQACPWLEIESCSSGGARADLGVLQHTGRIWASDNIDPISRISIQQGFLRWMPPEIMGAHVGHATAHLTGRTTGLHTRAILALQGQYGFELDARKLDNESREALRHYTQFYKQHRRWFAESDYWQLNTRHASLHASGMVDPEHNQAVFTVAAHDSLHTSRPGCLLLRGLDPQAHYRLNLESVNRHEFVPFNRVLPAWMDNPVTTSGELLMKLGVPLPVMPPQSALLLGCWNTRKTS